MDPENARTLFDAGGFLILPLEQEGQEFGIDGHVWAIRSFAGIKFLPPGLHLFLYSAPTSSTVSATFGSGITIRKGFFRFTRPGEVIVRSYDDTTEEIRLPSKKRKHGVDNNDSEASPADAPDLEAAETIVSTDYLKSLDPKLAPYPLDGLDTWRSLTTFITPETLTRVLGQDIQGDSRCDSLMASLADEFGGEAAQKTSKGKTFWGKPRPGPTETGHERSDAPLSYQTERLLRFVPVDVKKSWRQGATGEELTRDSRDKTWLLGQVVQEELKGEHLQLLAHLQLAYLIFTQLHNSSALDAYKRYTSILCRADSMYLPSSTGLSASVSLMVIRTFVEQVLLVHLRHLRGDFFAEDMPELESFFIEELGQLRLALRRANRYYMQNNASAFEPVRTAWSSLAAFTSDKFGWRLGGLEPHDPAMAIPGRKLYNLLAPSDEEDEYAEEGEDAPVVVQL